MPPKGWKVVSIREEIFNRLKVTVAGNAKVVELPDDVGKESGSGPSTIFRTEA
jgi:hypothetical protein